MERNPPYSPPCSHPSKRTPAPSVAGHPADDDQHHHPLNNKKSGPEQCKVRKNRLHSRGIWAKIASRRIIRAGREVREHPTPLCRRKRLPHSKITCATLIIPIISLFYKGNLHGLVCFRAVQGHTYLHGLFVRPAGSAHGGREAPPPRAACPGRHSAQAHSLQYILYKEETRP